MFTVAVLMLLYDALGHLLAALAHLSADKFNNKKVAILWNNYSIYVFPRISKQMYYHMFWGVWHSITLFLFIMGYFYA